MRKTERLSMRSQLNVLETNSNSPLDGQGGAAILEFTLVALLFFYLLFGIIEFGILLFNQQVVTNAGREGARLGIVCRPVGERIVKADIEAEVRKYAEQHIISFGAKNLTIVPTSTRAGAALGDSCQQFQDELTVQVSYDYSFLVLPFGTKTLGAKAVMVCE